MKAEEFVRLRNKLGKTQKEIAQLLGKSLKAIHSYEQGWRKIPPDAERTILFLLFKKRSVEKPFPACWTIIECPDERRGNCPAWEYRCGEACWFINGTTCAGKTSANWQEKMETCRRCRFFRLLFREDFPDAEPFGKAVDPKPEDRG